MENHSEIEIDSKLNYKININLYLPEKIKAIMIWLHGFGGSKETITGKEFSKKLNIENIGLITFNFPSHGNSKSEDDTFTLENCINDFESVENYIRENYKNIPIGIIGTSLGAYVILIRINSMEKINYFCIILLSPALKFNEIFKNHLLKDSMKDFRKKGFVYAGFSKKIRVPYIFYEETENNKIFNIFKVDYPMLIIHGTKDEIAPFMDSVQFVKSINKNAILEKIEKGDHRFMGSGQLDLCFSFAFDYIVKCFNIFK